MVQGRLKGEGGMGEIVKNELELEVVVSEPGHNDSAPEFSWMLSEEAEAALREIDASIRAAEQMSGSLVFG